MTYGPGQRVVSINFAYGHLHSSKLCAGTVVSSVDDQTVEVAWDDGETVPEYVGDIIHIGLNDTDETFGNFAPCVTKSSEVSPRPDPVLPWPIFEESTSPLRLSNDGVLEFDLTIANDPRIYLVRNRVTGQALIATYERVLVDAYIAGYDEAKRLQEEA